MLACICSALTCLDAAFPDREAGSCSQSKRGSLPEGKQKHNRHAAKTSRTTQVIGCYSES